jgi:hypothetical protein
MPEPVLAQVRALVLVERVPLRALVSDPAPALVHVLVLPMARAWRVAPPAARVSVPVLALLPVLAPRRVVAFAAVSGLWAAQ